MFYSLTAFLTVNLFISLIVILLWIHLKSNHLIIGIGSGVIFLFISLVVIRLLIPAEFKFSNSLGLSFLLPEIVSVLRTTEFNLRECTISLKQVISILWILGAIVYLARTAISYFRLISLTNRMPQAYDDKLQNALQDVLHYYSHPVDFKVIQTELTTTPMVLGFITPRIVVPLMNLSEEEWNFIFAHEVSHYYHFNLWIKILMEFVCAIYWWNPFIFLFKKQVDKLLELHTDFTVTKTLDQDKRIAYLECLLKIAKNPNVNQPNKLSLTFDSRKSSVLLQRFHMVLDGYDHCRKFCIRAFLLKAVPMLLLLFLSFTVVIEPYYIPPQDKNGTVELTNKTSFLIENPNGGFNVYLNNKYYATVENINESFSNLPVFQNLKEALNESNY